MTTILHRRMFDLGLEGDQQNHRYLGYLIVVALGARGVRLQPLAFALPTVSQQLRLSGTQTGLLVFIVYAALFTDGVSTGPVDDGAATHLAGLAHGQVFVECLTQVQRLPPRGAFFLFLELRIVDGTGGPGRAIALLPGGE